MKRRAILGSLAILTAVNTLHAASIGLPLTVYSQTSGAATTSGGGWGTTSTAPNAVDVNGGGVTGEYTLATGGKDAWIVFNLGQKTTFSDVSLTQRDYVGGGVLSSTPNNFLIQVQDNDDPTAATGWTTIATASNIFGYNLPTANNYNAGRRVTFAAQNKQYFRYVNTNTATETISTVSWNGVSVIAAVRVGRDVLLTDASANVTGPAYALNLAADGDVATTMRLTGKAASFTFDAKVPAGQGVQSITLQHSNAVNGYFPTGTVRVYSSNDPANFTTYTDFTLSSDTTAGKIYSLNFTNPIDARYFKTEWSATTNSAATYTEFAEIGITTAAIPEPAAISLVAGASLLCLRRRRSR